MPKMPRDVSGQELSRILEKYDYKKSRQTGSHIRLVSLWKGTEHKITIPNHDSIKIGTLNNILSDIAEYLNIDKASLVENLFEK